MDAIADPDWEQLEAHAKAQKQLEGGAEIEAGAELDGTSELEVEANSEPVAEVAETEETSRD